MQNVGSEPSNSVNLLTEIPTDYSTSVGDQLASKNLHFGIRALSLTNGCIQLSKQTCYPI